MASYTQEGSAIRIQTPLGDDALLLEGFSGSEATSRPFHYSLDLLSEDHAIPAKDIVGKNVTFSVDLAEGKPRPFNGFVRRFVQLGPEYDLMRYRAEVVPLIWFLSLSHDCRIFQFKSVQDIVEQVFEDHGISDFRFSLTGNHPQRDYCVQYRESTLGFLERLMQEEGIFYYFEHDDGKHEMVIADYPGALKDCPGQSTMRMAPQEGAWQDEDVLTSLELEHNFHTGKVALTDYNFETPSTSLLALETATTPNPPVLSNPPERYDYPGLITNKGDAEARAREWIEAHEAEYEVIRGQSNVRSLVAGHKVTIEEHHNEEVNKTYVITSISHTARAGDYRSGRGGAFEYQNHFVGMPADIPLRPLRVNPKPVVQGSHTAVVVGPAGEEIYPDEFGRVKVQFHWDREGKKDENSSCWIRVATTHAGKGWGYIDIPRIGEEVIVDYLEGDPDRPIITGRVYHAEQMPPFALPANKNISGIKTNSTKGGGGYNELVMDDTKGNELIRIHAQFDMDSTVENDNRCHILHDESTDVANDRTEQVGNDETIDIGHDRTETVGNNETVTIGVDQSISIGSNRTENVGADETITIGANRTESVGSNESVSIGSNRDTNVASNETTSVGGDRSVTIGKGDSLKVGKKLKIEAGDEILIKTGKASILMKKDGTITISGKDITLKGSGKINMKASKDMILKGKKVLQN